MVLSDKKIKRKKFIGKKTHKYKRKANDVA